MKTEVKNTAIIRGQDKNMSLLAYAAKTNVPALLVGPTGCGKTGAVQQLAREHSKECLRINLNGQTSTDEILGKYLLKDGKTYWVDGALTHAVKQGLWVLIDEVNAAAPEVLFALHSLLDDDRKLLLTEKGDHVEVQPHSDFRFFASMNPPTVSYGGVRDLNSAFLSRFPVVTDWEYPDRTTEAMLIQERANLETEPCVQLSAIGNFLRKLYSEEKIMYVCSTRDLLSCAYMVSNGYLIAEALEAAILNRIFDPTERKLVMEVFKQVAGAIFPEEAKGLDIAAVLDAWTNREQAIKTLQKELEVKSKVVKEIFDDLSEGKTKKASKKIAAHAGLNIA